MSYTPRCRPRFKGIESFLRRLAFNLGNTASQTEVKIISCIPIDVTDLQNRICELERELETYSVGCEAANVKHVCHTALVSVLPPLFEPPRPCEYKASDAKDGIPEPAPPEDEPPEPLHTVGAPVDVICKSRCSSARSPPAKKLVLEPINNNAPGVPGTPMSERKVYSISNKIVTKERYKVKEKRRKERRKRDYGKSPLVYYARTETKSPFEPIEEPHNCEHRAYHNRKDNGVKVTLDRNYFVSNQEINKGYLSNMVRKQYEHYPMGTAISGTSEFSTPVCRDPPPHAHDTKRNESDICSCCHGTFHNIDDTMRLPPHGVMRDTTTLHSISQYAQPVSNNNVFYDSSLYDVEPVREKTMKQRRDEIDYINPDSKRFATRDVYLSNAKRVKLRKQHNYRNTTPLRVIPKYYAHRKRNNSGVTTQRKESLNILPELIKTSWKRKDSPRASFVSAIDLSPVYTRPNCNFNNSNFSSIPAKIPVELKNAECLTTSVNNSQCQTTSTKSVQLETSNTVDENKTEITLNQIKTILQLVLTEVKTSAQSRIAHERIPKKDAVVQKDQSLNNMQSQPAPVPKAKPMHDAVSSIMNSCNYSPYNLRPYGPSCSRLPPSGPLSPFQPNCMHNYPLFIQTTGRQCTCCYRSIPKGVNATGPALMSHASPPNVTQQPPATIATNTEKRSNRELPSRSPETDKLIQEIYKSIAVNMDHFAKNSTSDCNDLKSSSPSKKTTETGLPTDNERKKQVGIAMVHRQSNILSNVRSKSVLSPAPVSKTTLGTPSPRHSQRQTYAFVKERVSSESLQREMVTLRRRGAVLVRSSSSQSDSSTLTSNASESEKTVTRPRVDDQKAEKPSLFKKMVNLFSGKKKPVRKEQLDVPYKEEETDSDDYQTVCSHKMDREQRRRAGQVMQYRRFRKPHSKVSNSKAPKIRRSPYMEQEYRRDWNERLIFQPDKPIFSSEKPATRETSRVRRHY